MTRRDKGALGRDKVRRAGWRLHSKRRGCRPHHRRIFHARFAIYHCKVAGCYFEPTVSVNPQRNRYDR